MEIFLDAQFGIQMDKTRIAWKSPQCHRCHLRNGCLITHRFCVTVLHHIFLCQSCLDHIQVHWNAIMETLQSKLCYSYWKKRMHETFYYLDLSDGWYIDMDGLLFPVIQHQLYIPLRKENRKKIMAMRQFCILNDVPLSFDVSFLNHPNEAS